MTLEEFAASVSAPAPPRGLPRALEAMWHDAHGDWTRAHEVAQDIDDQTGAWIHAYLHRKEGDAANAAYWYRRARRGVAHESLSDEWRTIVQTLLETADL